MVFDAQPPVHGLKSIDTGPITNHVNFARPPTVPCLRDDRADLNEVKVFRTDVFFR